MCVCVGVCVYICVQTSISMCTYFVQVQICIYMYISIYRLYVYIYIYIYIGTQHDRITHYNDAKTEPPTTEIHVPFWLVLPNLATDSLVTSATVEISSGKLKAHGSYTEPII